MGDGVLAGIKIVIKIIFTTPMYIIEASHG
jgi:hypothetical protein